MLRTLLAQRLRSCGPAFGFLARVLGAYMLDIIVCEIAGLQRHSNPVHGRALFCAKSSWCRDASSGRRHEGTTVKRCHFNLPDFLELGSDQAKCKARRACTGNATTLAEYRKAPCNYLNDKKHAKVRVLLPSLQKDTAASPFRFTNQQPVQFQTARQCGAQPKSGKPCRSPATKKGRCRLHGGARGSGAPPGERNGQYRHGSGPRPRLRSSRNSASHRKCSALA